MSLGIFHDNKINAPSLSLGGIALPIPASKGQLQDMYIYILLKWYGSKH